VWLARCNKIRSKFSKIISQPYWTSSQREFAKFCIILLPSSHPSRVSQEVNKRQDAEGGSEEAGSGREEAGSSWEEAGSGREEADLRKVKKLH
jgi:hypothetical protein